MTALTGHTEASPPLSRDEYLPETVFGKDHWTVLMYAHTHCLQSGFRVVLDAHMRHNRRNYRVLRSSAAHLQAATRSSQQWARVMEAGHATLTFDGSLVEGHDDWDCCQDLVEAGYLEGEVEPLEYLKITEKGMKAVSEITLHKQSGGAYRTFTPSWVQR